ncbi:four helix bundle protein [Pseudotenacibaculum sp. MALMAid0570]|uniref:four helix bundle protein n=1 Tax=Pseudotenacibaculum sp. MALMAid0570 TaxID=3143938 RepID=UPI0032DF6910
MKRENIILDKSFDFALTIIDLYKKLKNESEHVISKQLLRSGTSIGANVQEATAAFSRKDFVHKMSISSKEARETRYWLQLIDKSELTKINVQNHLIEVENLVKILTKIVKTTQEKK